MNIVKTLILLSLLVLVLLGLLIQAGYLVNSLFQAIPNKITNNTAENLCLREGGVYSSLGFGGGDRCYGDGRRHDLYMEKGKWKITK